MTEITSLVVGGIEFCLDEKTLALSPGQLVDNDLTQHNRNSQRHGWCRAVEGFTV